MANIPLKTIKFPGLDDTYTVPQIDSNFTGVAGEAPDSNKVKGEISSLKEDLNAVSDALRKVSDIDFTGLTRRNAYINTSNKWSVSPDGRKCYTVSRPADAEVIIIGANDSANTTYAFLTADTITNQQTPAFCTGHQRVVVNAGDTITANIPSDCQYIYILATVDGETDNMPDRSEFVSYPTIAEQSVLFSEAQELTDAQKAVARSNIGAGDASTIDKINSYLFDSDIDLTADVVNAFINTSNKWSSSGSSFIMPVPDADVLTVTANDTQVAVVALLKSNEHAQNTTPDYATGSTRTVIEAGAKLSLAVPSDAKYVYIMRTYSGTVYTPQKATWTLKAVQKDDVIPLGLHEMPRNTTALNIVKRCRQMTDIKWTPAVDLDRYMLVQCDAPVPESATAQKYLGTFKAGTEYKGVPYGRVSGTMQDYGYNYATVGHYIGFDTFVSSVSNPNSKLCKEDVGSVAQHISVIYATVCSGLTCYALNVGEVPTANIANISNLQEIGKINDNGVLLDDSQFEIGDVLNLYDYHTAIITDIIRDSAGIIQFVELSDASTAGLADRNYSDGPIGGVCRRKGWSRERLFNDVGASAGGWGGYTLYRYTGSVPYTPSLYVNVGDEFDCQRIEHFPCMPYEGEGFVYKSGYIPDNAVKILTSLGGYAYLRVFKDGTEITGSPFAVANDTEYISVEEISAGNYSAYLCNMSGGDVTNLTYACHWSIAE